MAYASEKGAGFIDRELFLPEEWLKDNKRRKATGVPEERNLGKPQPAQQMLKRALEAGVKAAWVVADTVYSSWQVRNLLEEQQQSYIPAVPPNFMVRFIDDGGVQQPHIKTLFKKLEPEAWHHLSAGSGGKGERLYDWRG